MFLVINTVANPAKLVLFDNQRHIIDQYEWDSKRAEFDSLMETISSFLGKNDLGIHDLSGIVCIIGPGSFTGIRITTLVVNTLAYVYKMPIFWIELWEFLRLSGSKMPYLSPMTRRESLIWEISHETWKIIDNALLIPWTYTTCDAALDLGENYCLNVQNDYTSFVQKVDLHNPVMILRPLYARDPNITLRNYASRTNNTTSRAI